MGQVQSRGGAQQGKETQTMETAQIRARGNAVHGKEYRGIVATANDRRETAVQGNIRFEAAASPPRSIGSLPGYEICTA
jgi:hypothetical protein